jgi:hypothetical protein
VATHDNKIYSFFPGSLYDSFVRSSFHNAHLLPLRFLPGDNKQITHVLFPS